MTSKELLVKDILRDNEDRAVKLAAKYDAVTGLGAPLQRKEFKVSDYAIPVQYVPIEMFDNPLVRKIAKAGSIAKYLATKEATRLELTFHQVELLLRRIRHKYDFCAWAYFLIKIKRKTGGRGPFVLNLPQQIVLEECERLRKMGVPINIIICKARQWGGSTFCIFYQTWLAFKWDKFHSFAVAAQVQSASETIVKMLKDAIVDYPAWDFGLPEAETLHLANAGKTGNSFVIKTSKDVQVIPATIFIGSVENPDSLRSKDISGAHYSEVGVWKDTPEKRPEDLIADISGGILHQPLSMQVMESTAKNSDDYFHSTYIEAKNGHSSYHAVFIPWFKIPHDTLRIEDPQAFAQWLLDCKDKDQPPIGYKDAGKHYWRLWQLGATLEGINWYIHKRLEFQKYKQMANEVPSDDVEAFTSAGNKVFDTYEIEEMAKGCKDYIYEGELISDAREGEEVLDNIRFIPRREGNLKVWEKPDYAKIDNRYVVCVDVGGENPTSDYSSVRVLDRMLLMPEYDGIPNIVAEMHYHTPHYLLAYDAMRLAAWYNNALLVIESNTLETKDQERDTEGDGSQYILEIVGGIYPNLYMREASPDTIKEGRSNRWGFHTNTKTKPQIIDNMKRCLHDRLWAEPSRTCLDEMSMYIQERGKMTAPTHRHDDVLMCTAILLFVCYHKMDLPHWSSPPKSMNTIIDPNSTAHF